MLFPAFICARSAHFFFFVLRVQGADGSFPKPLTPDEEAVLLRRMQQDGDAEAKAELIEHNLRLVAHIVKKVLRRKYGAGRSAVHRHDRAD